MKAAYTVTVTRNSDGEQILDFDLQNLNYRVEASDTGTVTISGSFLIESKEEKLITKASPCTHDWIPYRGLSEEFKICGTCGIKCE